MVRHLEYVKLKCRTKTLINNLLLNNIRQPNYWQYDVTGSLNVNTMDFHKQLSKNLIVHYSETLSTNEDGSLKKVRFNCDFFGQYMIADVIKKNVEKDWSTITGEGASELWDSFENQMEDEHWEELKEMFRQHEIEHKSTNCPVAGNGFGY